MLKKLFVQLYFTSVLYVPNFIRELFVYQKKSKYIVLKSFLDFRMGIWRKQNWGDDLNVFLCASWFNKKIINYSTSVLSWMSNDVIYSFIGSILQSANRRTVVWGSGLISEDEYPKEAPKRICAVRGPLSRKVLQEHGIECPEVYGDPALLLSRYYTPKEPTKKFRLGIVAHVCDEKNQIIRDFLRKDYDVIQISLSSYERWQDVVDQVCSCEAIVSSSLHGLVVADAYGIPNTWIEFSDLVIGLGFKFRDYFMSVNREIRPPHFIHSVEDLEKLYFQEMVSQPIEIDLEPLINSCPFKLPF